MSRLGDGLSAQEKAQEPRADTGGEGRRARASPAPDSGRTRHFRCHAVPDCRRCLSQYQGIFADQAMEVAYGLQNFSTRLRDQGLE